MRRSPALNCVLVVSVLLLSVPRSAWAEPATPIPSRDAATNRRVVSAYPTESLFPSGFVSFIFGDDIHQPGPACDLLPPDLDLHYLTLERTDAGYTATTIFFAPIQPLSELNGKPVTHTVKVTFYPPSGDQVFLRISLSTGKLTVQRGKTKLEGDEAKGASVGLLADRLIFTIPRSLGIDPTWAVSARVAITSKNDAQICDGIPVTHLDAFIAPATVGSLTGDDPAGTITFPADGISLNDPNKLPGTGAKMPKGSKIASLRFEQSATGGLVVVATMDADLTDLAEHGAPAGDVTVVLNLAGPDFFGLQQPYTVEWRYEPGKPMLPTARVYEPHGYGFKMGDVPVTVDGRDVRFDFGGYVPYVRPENATEPESDLLVPFGDFATSFVAPSTLANAMCLCPEEVTPADLNATPVVYDDFEYVVIGNLLSIKRVSTDSTAYGWIDADGHFLAENDEDLYRGIMKIVPQERGYDLGVDGVYTRKLAEQPIAFSAEAPSDFTLVTTFSDRTLPSSSAPMPYSVNAQDECAEGCLALILFYAFIVLSEFDSSDFYYCLFSSDPTEDCEKLEDALLALTLLQAIANDPVLSQLADNMLANTNGMSMPSGSFGGGGSSGQLSTMSAPTTSSGVPFPLPLPSPDVSFQPVPADTDWAIRAESVFLNHEDGVSTSVSGPFVDSHLLMTDTATSTSSAIIDAPGSSTGAWLTERRRSAIRRKRRRLTPRR